MGIEKIATQEELCDRTIDKQARVITDMKDFYLFPIKLRLAYCPKCDSLVVYKGVDYCLRKEEI